MKRITVPLCAALIVVALTATLSAQSAPEKQIFTLESVNYPDGTMGLAVVTVNLSAASPTVLVTAEYYTDGGAHYLGSYEDWSNNGELPRDRYEAERFALVHFYDKW